MLAARNTLDFLVNALVHHDYTTDTASKVAATLRNARVDCRDLQDYISFVPGRYTRNLVFRNHAFELMILCWSLGSESPIHDHGGRQCAMLVLNGSLTVADYAILSGGRREGFAHIAAAGTTRLHAGALDVRTRDRDLHRVSALHEQAISLHVYAKPLDRFMLFQPNKRSCRTVFSRYDTRIARLLA